MQGQATTDSIADKRGYSAESANRLTAWTCLGSERVATFGQPSLPHGQKEGTSRVATVST